MVHGTFRHSCTSEAVSEFGILDLKTMNPDEPAPAPDYSEDGVDLSLIRWALSLTPAERLEFLERRINDILAIRELNART